MAETFTVRFTPTEQDYVRAGRFMMLRNFWIWGGFFVLLELCTIIGVLNQYSLHTPFAWLPALLMPALFGWGLLVIFPSQFGRAVRRNAKMLGEHTWELGTEQVNQRSGAEQVSKLNWTTIQGVTENREYFFIRLRAANRLRRVFVFIPKRAFGSLEEQTQFREFVNRQIASHRDASVAPPGPKS